LPKFAWRLQVTGSLAVKLTDWPASMEGAVAGAVKCSPCGGGGALFPPPQLVDNRHKGIRAIATARVNFTARTSSGDNYYWAPVFPERLNFQKCLVQTRLMRCLTLAS
jgi:hypothetical protein